MNNQSGCWFLLLVMSFPAFSFAQKTAKGKTPPEPLQSKTIGISVDPADGGYTIFDRLSKKPILSSRVAAEVDHQWLKSSDYRQHNFKREDINNDLGPATSLTIENTGLPGKPDLIYTLKLYSDPDYVTIAAKVRNSGSGSVEVQALRTVEAMAPAMAALGGPDASDRVLSDSFSEDRPGISIHDLSDQAMHRAVGSQLIYNRDTKRNLFLGTLTSDKFLTILRLHTEKGHITAYEVDSAGTTELEKENSVQYSAPEDQVELSLPVAPGAELASEQLLISTGRNYHEQLDNYGAFIRKLHHARVSAPSAIGWWSWTAYYFGLNEDTALTNATWLAQNLKDLGYNFFHIDEGYQYARGEYTTPDATLFPHGLRRFESNVRELGLTPGIWTAPFEISERSSVFEDHKDWLVHNAAGQPIHAGWVNERQHLDPLYVIDCTNPGAQEYLRQTYKTLAEMWGIRYIKLDFMDDTAIEGFYYKPHTTALEAQRIGLQVIRDAVGENVLLDKDGSVMLNPVGLVDTGRISVDTGHTFQSSKEAAPGIAARYYMNRNFYVADPDAFTVSRQVVHEHEWHGGKYSLTLDDAKVSTALAAIAGGMYEIGDDLPTLGLDADRMALVKNQDLLNMARIGRSSRPLDLMSYSPEDSMPSIFLLNESKRQSILTVFNWTEKPTEHKLEFSRDLGLNLAQHNEVFDVFEAKSLGQNLESLSLSLLPHSVRVLKIVDSSVAPVAPTVKFEVPQSAEAGKAVRFEAAADSEGVPATTYHWDFGDGTATDQGNTWHAYTHEGDFTVKVRVDGADGLAFEKSMDVKVSGEIHTRFVPANKKRLRESQ